MSPASKCPDVDRPLLTHAEIAGLDHEAVNSRMVKLAAQRKGMAAFGYRMLTGTAQYTPGHVAASMATVEALDAPRRCEVVATTAAERFGFGVVNGYVLIGSSVAHAELIAHYWNLDQAGRLVDGALARRRPIGYLGKRLSERELDAVSRFAFLSLVG